MYNVYDVYNISTRGNGVYTFTYKGKSINCNLKEVEAQYPGFTEYINTYNWLQYLGAI